jgi:hypothetical protein
MNRLQDVFINNPFECKAVISGVVAAISGGYVTIANYTGSIDGFEYKGALGLLVIAVGYLVNELRLAKNEQKETVKTFVDKLQQKEDGVVTNQRKTIELLEDLLEVNKQQLDDFKVVKNAALADAIKKNYE